MKSVLLYTANGDYIAVRRPIGFARPIEVSPAVAEEWSDNAPDQVTGTVVGYPSWTGWETKKRDA